MKYLNVTMLADAWFPHVGGGQIHVREIASRLSKYNIKVTVVTRNLGSSEDKNFKVVKLGWERKFTSIFGRIEYLMRALIYCINHDYDILHAHAFSPGLLVPILKILKGSHSVFTVHGKGVKIAGLGLRSDFLENLVVYKNMYDLEITVAKASIIKKVNAKKLIVIPNGVNIETFKKGIRSRKEIRKILYVGRLSEEKGLDLLLEAFNKVKREISLTVVGEGDDFSNQLNGNIKKKVMFKGKIEGEQLIEEYKKADLLVIPSRTEGLPLVLFEAWACKLPVLATNVGDVGKYLHDGVNGFLCKSSADSIKLGIDRAIKSNDLKRIINKAYLEVQQYSWDKIAQITANEYWRLVR